MLGSLGQNIKDKVKGFFGIGSSDSATNAPSSEYPGMPGGPATSKATDFQPIVGDMVNAANAALTNSVNTALDRSYKMGGKDFKGTGGIDCSGFVSGVLSSVVDDVNTEATKQGKGAVFDKDTKKLWQGKAAYEILKNVSEATGTGQDIIKASQLKEGMVLGLDAAGPGSDPRGNKQYKGIDHTMIVGRDPKSGQLRIGLVS